MPIFFIIVGILLIVVAINDKMGDLSDLMRDDFDPSSGNSFVIWIVAVFVIGSLGYVKTMKPVANAFLVLVVISMLLSNRGFFNNFTKAFRG